MPSKMKLVSGLAVVLSLITIIQSCRQDAITQVEEKPDSFYIEAGDQIVKQTFDSLRNSLLRQIGQTGFEGAIEFCNENASALTSSHADSTIIRRTALRYRNPDNRPDSLELVVLREMSSDMEGKKVLASKVVRDYAKSEIHYFKPIMTQAVCLNCHGKPSSEIRPAVQSAITAHYPSDKAVNFREGDLRGAWHILFRLK